MCGSNSNVNYTGALVVLIISCMANIHFRNKNKSAQSNLGRGPRRGAVAYVRREVPIGYNGAFQIRPQKVPLPVDRSPNPATCLIPGPVRPMMPNNMWIRSAVLTQCTGQTDRPTDRSRESLMTIGRYTRATRPKNLRGIENYRIIGGLGCRL